ncbi:hypothetical protein EDB85DRAFT_1903907 [Lactarius pseudohatsudake]|nr:hypothetical protein EDB85DRAFT_1903907 [Lactarius pseudohatsudake]
MLSPSVSVNRSIRCGFMRAQRSRHRDQGLRSIICGSRGRNRGREPKVRTENKRHPALPRVPSNQDRLGLYVATTCVSQKDNQEQDQEMLPPSVSIDHIEEFDQMLFYNESSLPPSATIDHTLRERKALFSVPNFRRRGRRRAQIRSTFHRWLACLSPKLLHQGAMALTTMPATRSQTITPSTMHGRATSHYEVITVVVVIIIVVVNGKATTATRK